MNGNNRAARLGITAVLLALTPVVSQPIPDEELFVKGEAMRIEVPADPESFLNGVYPLDATGMAELPIVGKIVIAGKTRQNVEKYLGEVWTPYLRDTHLFAKPVIRVGVLGNVHEPGYYYVPPEAVVWDVIQQAGGPPKPGKIDEAAHMRRGKSVNGSLIEAISERRTLKEAGIASGDAIVLPIPPDPTRLTDILQLSASVLSIMVSALTAYAILGRE